jgi:hypothetical protein
MNGRRQFFGVAAAGLGALWWGSEAAACSLTGTNRTPFDDRKSRAAIAGFVKLLNEAPSMPQREVTRLQEDLGFVIESEWVDEELGDRSPTDVERQTTFVREFRTSEGKLDPRPITIDGINLIRRLGNQATYQFTLKRYSYHPADPEGCNGMFVHDEYYGYNRTSCLATLLANRLQTVRRFPEWYLEPARQPIG